MRILKKIYEKLLHISELSKYNDFTISEYFRKQGATIGVDNRIEVRSLGSEPFLISIGNHCTIAPNVSFLTHDGATWLFTEEYPSLQKFGKITIGDNCFVGANSILMGGITVGSSSVIGAGSVVTKDVLSFTVVAGNPARLISSLEDYKKKVFDIWETQKPENYFNDAVPGKKYSPQQIHNIKQRDFEILRKHLEKIL